MATDTPDLVGTVEAAEIIGCERSSLSRWVALGKIAPALQVGTGTTGAHLFHRSDVEALAASYQPRRRAS
jgi:predicted site-specific integrase-resolvase